MFTMFDASCSMSFRRASTDDLLSMNKSEFLAALKKHRTSIALFNRSEADVPLFEKYEDELSAEEWCSIAASPFLQHLVARHVGQLDDTAWISIVCYRQTSPLITMHAEKWVHLGEPVWSQVIDAPWITEVASKYPQHVPSKYTKVISDKLRLVWQASQYSGVKSLEDDRIAQMEKRLGALEAAMRRADEEHVEYRKTVSALVLSTVAKITGDLKERISLSEDAVAQLKTDLHSLTEKINGFDTGATKSTSDLIGDAVREVARVLHDNADFDETECRLWFEKRLRRTGQVPDAMVIKMYMAAEWGLEYAA